MFCAQIVGKPLTKPEPMAPPARPAAPLRSRRRLTRGFERALSFMTSSSLVRPELAFRGRTSTLAASAAQPVFVVADLLPPHLGSQAHAPAAYQITSKSSSFRPHAGSQGRRSYSSGTVTVLKRDACP